MCLNDIFDISSRERILKEQSIFFSLGSETTESKHNEKHSLSFTLIKPSITGCLMQGNSPGQRHEQAVEMNPHQALSCGYH